MHAFFMDALPILNEPSNQHSLLLKRPAYQDIIDKLQAPSQKVTLLFTGPLTDLAKAITVEPTIVQNIDCLVWMGGYIFR